jgi:hypothetical protein
MPAITTLTGNLHSSLIGFKLDELPQRYREAHRRKVEVIIA